jgi:hypothetical protein
LKMLKNNIEDMIMIRANKKWLKHKNFNEKPTSE